MIKTDNIKDIKSAIETADSDTLVVFDCDDVLTTLSEHVWKECNRQFFVEWCGKNIPNFCSESFYDIADSILISSKNFLVNDEMPNLVDGLGLRGIKAVVLTALSTRPISSITNPMTWRIDTLKSFGYDFEKFWSLADKSFQDFRGEYTPAYSSGVICCGSEPKSKCLDKFLDYAKISPKKVIFIDDKSSNIEDLSNFCAIKEIEFVGIEYHEAMKVTSDVPFSEMMVEHQLRTLRDKKVWISDAEFSKYSEAGDLIENEAFIN